MNRGALVFAHSGSEARAAFGIDGTQWGNSDGPYSHMYDYDKHGNMISRFGWGGEVQGGAPYGHDTNIAYTYSTNKNQRDGFLYDAAGNLTNDSAYIYSYDASGQQTTANRINYALQQGYDGDGLRGRKIENGATTYYLRSAVLGGAVVAEIDAAGGFSRGYYYAGSDLVTVQQSNHLYWVHEDSITKSKRITDVYGATQSTVELDPWGADTNRSSNSAFMPQSFTSYTRDTNGGQDAMARRYNVGGQFSQPDSYGGSYDFSDPQSLNRYAYTGNDPVNRSDPSGLDYTYGFFGLPRPPASPGLPPWLTSGGRDGGVRHQPPYVVEPHERDHGGDPGGPDPQNPHIDPNILDRTDALLKKPKCKQFLNAMLAELGRATGRGRDGVSFEQLFAAARGSIYSSPNLGSRGNAGQKLIGEPGLSIEILIRPTVPTDAQSAPTSIMHEIFHDAPGSGLQYNHTDMVRAAFAVADAMGMTKDHDYPLQLGQQPKPFEGTYDEKRAADNWNSSLFQQILVHACQ